MKISNAPEMCLSNNRRLWKWNHRRICKSRTKGFNEIAIVFFFPCATISGRVKDFTARGYYLSYRYYYKVLHRSESIIAVSLMPFSALHSASLHTHAASYLIALFSNFSSSSHDGFFVNFTTFFSAAVANDMWKLNCLTRISRSQYTLFFMLKDILV